MVPGEHNKNHQTLSQASPSIQANAAYKMDYIGNSHRSYDTSKTSIKPCSYKTRASNRTDSRDIGKVGRTRDAEPVNRSFPVTRHGKVYRQKLLKTTVVSKPDSIININVDPIKPANTSNIYVHHMSKGNDFPSRPPVNIEKKSLPRNLSFVAHSSRTTIENSPSPNSNCPRPNSIGPLYTRMFSPDIQIIRPKSTVTHRKRHIPYNWSPDLGCRELTPETLDVLTYTEPSSKGVNVLTDCPSSSSSDTSTFDDSDDSTSSTKTSIVSTIEQDDTHEIKPLVNGNIELQTKVKVTQTAMAHVKLIATDMNSIENKACEQETLQPRKVDTPKQIVLSAGERNLDEEHTKRVSSAVNRDEVHMTKTHRLRARSVRITSANRDRPGTNCYILTSPSDNVTTIPKSPKVNPDKINIMSPVSKPKRDKDLYGTTTVQNKKQDKLNTTTSTTKINQSKVSRNIRIPEVSQDKLKTRIQEVNQDNVKTRIPEVNQDSTQQRRTERIRIKCINRAGEQAKNRIMTLTPVNSFSRICNEMNKGSKVRGPKSIGKGKQVHTQDETSGDAFTLKYKSRLRHPPVDVEERAQTTLMEAVRIEAQRIASAKLRESETSPLCNDANDKEERPGTAYARVTVYLNEEDEKNGKQTTYFTRL